MKTSLSDENPGGSRWRETIDCRHGVVIVTLDDRIEQNDGTRAMNLYAIPDALSGYEMLDEERAALMMDCEERHVETARISGAILGLPIGGGKFHYPGWQFRYDGQPYFEMSRVMTALVDPDDVYLFMTTANPSIRGVTPAEQMKLSREETLESLAREWRASRVSTG